MLTSICVVALSLMAGMPRDRMPASEPVGSAQEQLADARPYTHCHNLPRRTYCHASQKLPKNWPPNSAEPERARDGNERSAPLPNTVEPAGEERK